MKQETSFEVDFMGANNKPAWRLRITPGNKDVLLQLFWKHKDRPSQETRLSIKDWQTINKALDKRS